MLAGVEQRTVARRAGLSESQVSLVLRGKRTLKPVVTNVAETLIRERVALAAQALVEG